MSIPSCPVMLQPMEEAGKAERSKHKFMVQSMFITGDVLPDNLDAAVSLIRSLVYSSHCHTR